MRIVSASLCTLALLIPAAAAASTTAQAAPTITVSGPRADVGAAPQWAPGAVQLSGDVLDAMASASQRAVPQQNLRLGDLDRADVVIRDAATVHLSEASMKALATNSAALFAPEVVEHVMKTANPILDWTAVTASLHAFDYDQMRAQVSTDHDRLVFQLQMQDVKLTTRLEHLWTQDWDSSFDAVEIEAVFAVGIVDDDLRVHPDHVRVRLRGSDFPLIPDFAWVEDYVASWVEDIVADLAREQVPRTIHKVLGQLEASIALSLGGFEWTPAARLADIAIDPSGVTTVFDFGMTFEGRNAQ